MTTAGVKYLGDANPTGLVMGRSATDKIGFYGLTTPIVRPTITAVTTGATATLTAGMALDIYTALVALGLITAG